MLDRSELIEKICLIVLDTENYSEKEIDLANRLLERLISGKLPLEVAISEYDDIINKNYENELESESGPYWLDKYKHKNVYKYLVKYESNELNLNEIRKMISSLVTHSFIELEKNPDSDANSLGIVDLIDLLKRLTESVELSTELRDDIDSVLVKYGYIKDKGGNINE